MPELLHLKEIGKWHITNSVHPAAIIILCKRVPLTCAVHLRHSSFWRPAVFVDDPEQLAVPHHARLALAVMVQLYPTTVAVSLQKKNRPRDHMVYGFIKN